jgi:Zn-finger nucleic acid-binding protein
MDSPITGTPMRPVDYEGVMIYECEDTGGELLSGEALAHVVRRREEVFGPELLRLLEQREPMFGVPIEEHDRVLVCPCCSTDMDVINYGGDSGVYIDTCPSCNTVWLDGDELDVLQALMEKWQDEAPEAIRGVAFDLERARAEAAEQVRGSFQGSRFSFVNAVINRLLDAA